MILIGCVDERNGMSFEGRRTSQDRIMRDDLRQLFPALSMDAYAYSLFSQDDVDYCYEICEDLTQCSYPCLVELLPPSQFEPHLEKVVLYQWHRQYPSTVQMDINLHDTMWECVDIHCFEGSSRDKITRAIFQKKGME